MFNQITTSFWNQWVNTWSIQGSLFVSVWDDNTVWDDTRFIFDNPVGTPVYGSRLI